MEKKLTLTEALAELKLLDKKIDKKIYELNLGKFYLIDYKVGKEKVTRKNKLTEQEIKDKAGSILQSLTDLMENRKILKAKIAEKNAVTKVTVNGKDYTIVEAIERKNNLSKEKEVVEILLSQLDSINRKVTDINERANKEVDTLLEAKLSSDSKNQNAQEIENLTKILLENKIATIIDPLNINEIVEKLQNDIDEFERQVDVALSIVNATTYIEI